MLKCYKPSFKLLLGIVIAAAGNVCHAQPLELESSTVFIPACLGKVSLLHSDHGFSVVKEGRERRVQKHDTDPLVRNLSEDQLKSFLQHGYLSISQMSNDDYALQAHVRLPGGGPVTASALYWITKSLCYGTAVAAASTAVVVTGGAAAGAITTAGVAAATGGASMGAVAVSGAIAATAGGTATAVTSTAATVTAAGSLAGAAAAVETASMGAFALGLWLPLP